MQEITDFSAPELDIYARLSENRLFRLNEPDTGVFIAESAKVVHRALDAGYEPVSMLAEKRLLDGGEAAGVLERCPHLQVFAADYDVLRNLTGFPMTRGVLCAMRRKRMPAAADVIKGAKRVAVLEGIVIPTNVGAIFRNAAAMGMDAVLVTDDCADPLGRRAIRVSMGCVFQIPWTYLPAVSSCGESGKDRGLCVQSGVHILRSSGFKTAAMALRDDALDIRDIRFQSIDALAVFLGSEGEGLAAQTIEECDYVIRIPMRHGVDSLNVAAASAVAFWELTVQPAGGGPEGKE